MCQHSLHVLYVYILVCGGGGGGGNVVRFSIHCTLIHKSMYGVCNSQCYYVMAWHD